MYIYICIYIYIYYPRFFMIYGCSKKHLHRIYFTEVHQLKSAKGMLLHKIT